MKIAMIGHKRIPSREGGIEIVVSELAVRMAAMGHQVTAYNRKGHHVAGADFDCKKQKAYLGVRLVWVPTPQRASLNAIVYSALATLHALFGQYDIIHFHAEGPSAMVCLAKLFHKRCIVTIHGLDWQRSKWGGFATRFLKYGEKTAARYADEIIVLSENVRQYFLETYGRRTVFLPNGISKPQLRNDSAIKAAYGLRKNSYILFLGRIVPEKGLDYLIDAYRQLHTDKKLVIAGGSSHTETYQEALRDRASANANILFTGFVEGALLESLYSNAYLYCLPSDLEGMPISLLEAMSYGNCCVTSDIPECTEVTGEYAVSFKKGDAADLARVLQRLLDDPAKTAGYKAQAADYILSAYSWEDAAARTLQLYGEENGKR